MVSNARRRVLILGARGHAQVVADILRQAAGDEIEPVGYLDDAPGLRGALIQRLPVLGARDDSATGVPARPLRPRVLAVDEV